MIKKVFYWISRALILMLLLILTLGQFESFQALMFNTNLDNVIINKILTFLVITFIPAIIIAFITRRKNFLKNELAKTSQKTQQAMFLFFVVLGIIAILCLLLLFFTPFLMLFLS